MEVIVLRASLFSYFIYRLACRHDICLRAHVPNGTHANGASQTFLYWTLKAGGGSTYSIEAGIR